MKGKILVVENETILVEAIRDILEREEYQVLTAQNGQEGLEILQNTKPIPDLILSDIMMPVMDGYEFIEHVKGDNLWGRIPFVFFTAKTERKDRNKARELLADDYLPKPFMMDELVLTVQSNIQRIERYKEAHQEEVQDVKSKIMTILHHELRTPLTYVIGYNDLLKTNTQDMENGQFRSLMSKIDRGAQRLRNLIENFIMLVELQTENAAENFELNEVVSDYSRSMKRMLRRYEEMAESEGQEIVVQIDPETPPIISNGDYLIKIVESLLDNAIKFSDEGTSILFRVRPYINDNGEEFAAFHVIDEGQGIPEESVPHIFEPFFQAVRFNNEHPGTGSGLSISKGLVDLHGGKIFVKTEEGEGSHFTVLIPAYYKDE